MEIKDKQILKRLLDINCCNLFYNENLKNYLSFRPENSYCKCLIECENEKALMNTLRVLNNKNAFMPSFKQTPIKHCLVGNGSNTLFRNTFYDGYVIKLGKDFKKIKRYKIDKNDVFIEVGAGINLFALNNYLKNHSYAGLEWSYGIPGSVGGAIIMNAGAFGGEIANHVIKVKIIQNGKFKWTSDFFFEYRNSSFKKNNDIIISVILKLKKGNCEEISKLQKEYLSKRLNNQPHEIPSVGSVFKKIFKGNEIIFPAKLIDNLGLKSVKIGGAEISSTHAGFIINSNSATSDDFIKLRDFAINEVKKAYDIKLESEVEIID